MIGRKRRGIRSSCLWKGCSKRMLETVSFNHPCHTRIEAPSHSKRNIVASPWGCSIVHAWDYRRYIIASSPSHTVSDKQSLEAELKYTKKKIESNFSNFSAWHQRTKVLPTLWRSMSPEQVGTSKEQGEFALVATMLVEQVQFILAHLVA